MKHREWPYPDLFVIDGGVAQVKSAISVAEKYAEIPVIGLAKANETIIISDRTICRKVSLPRNSLSLRYIMEIRDEAHKFARKYHHLLRRKKLLNILN